MPEPSNLTYARLVEMFDIMRKVPFTKIWVTATFTEHPVILEEEQVLVIDVKHLKEVGIEPGASSVAFMPVQWTRGAVETLERAGFHVRVLDMLPSITLGVEHA